ncbi:unnamed protein product, partial [Mesorhabditis spiculigera]
MILCDSFIIHFPIAQDQGTLVPDAALAFGVTRFPVSAMILESRSHTYKGTFHAGDTATLDHLHVLQPNMTLDGVRLALDFVHGREVVVPIKHIVKLTENPEFAPIALEMAAVGNLHDEHKHRVFLNCLESLRSLTMNPSFLGLKETTLKKMIEFARTHGWGSIPNFYVHWAWIVDAVAVWAQLNIVEGQKLMISLLVELPIDEVSLKELQIVMMTAARSGVPKESLAIFLDRIRNHFETFETETTQLCNTLSDMLMPSPPAPFRDCPLPYSPTLTGFSDIMEGGFFEDERLCGGTSASDSASEQSARATNSSGITSYALDSACSDHTLTLPNSLMGDTNVCEALRSTRAGRLIPFEFDCGDIPPSRDAVWEFEMLIAKKEADDKNTRMDLDFNIDLYGAE